MRIKIEIHLTFNVSALWLLNNQINPFPFVFYLVLTSSYKCYAYHLPYSAGRVYPTLQMTSEERAHKFHTDNASLPRSG